MSNDINDYTSYFNSYARISPSRSLYLKDKEAEFPNAHNSELMGLSVGVPYGRPELFVELDRVSYKRVYRIMIDECDFRNVPMPRLFLDVENVKGCAFNFPGLYAISLLQEEIDSYSDMELRWVLAHELKHSYQDSLTTNSRQSKQNELDADRAAVESTSYETALKVMSRYITENLSFHQKRQPISALFYSVATALGLASPEYCPLGRSRRYPSIGKRLREMRKWEKCLQQQVPSVDKD